MGYSHICSVVCLLMVGYIYAQSPVIIPEKSVYFLLEGADFKLDCVLKSSGSVNSPSVAFYKVDTQDPSSPGTLIEEGNSDGFNITAKANVIDGVTTNTLTLVKKNATFKDRGIYKCKKSGSNDDTSITVYVFRVKQEGAVLNETLPGPVELSCMAEGIPMTEDYTISWRHNENVLTEGDKYNIFQENGTLRINKPERADMGTYYCTFVFTANKLNVTPMEVVLKAPPKIDSSDNNKNMVQGDTLDLKCKVSGYPQPKVIWLKDGKALNHTGNTRIHVEPYEGSNTGKLKIYSLEYEDEGQYSCVATSEAMFENATAEMRVRVKDKLAALWPFLGIVAEVIVLCVIILVYEKKRSKQMSEEDDATDGNPEKATENKDVRHRRT